jgi:hypothetical protein
MDEEKNHMVLACCKKLVAMNASIALNSAVVLVFIMKYLYTGPALCHDEV